MLRTDAEGGVDPLALGRETLGILENQIGPADHLTETQNLAVPSGRVPPRPRRRAIPIACLLLAALLSVPTRAADRRLKDFPACPAVSSTTSVYVDRGIGASTSEAATPAQVCQAGATTTPAAGVVPKADGSGLLPVGFLPTATTSTLGAVILATPSSDTTAGHAVQASDARLSDARAPTTHGAASHSGNVFPLDAGQVLGLGYIDFTGQAASGVGNPSGGAKRRLIFDTTTGELAVKSITGIVFGLEHAAWAPGASTTLTAHCVLIGNGGSAPALACPSTAGQVLTSNGATSDPSFQIVGATSPTMTNATINQAANGDTAITSTRATDTAPTGSFSLYKSAAGATLWNVDITGSLAAGTVPVARVSGLAASATTDTTNAANISSGTLGAARLGTGTPSSSTFLRGDQTWAAAPGTGTVTSVTLALPSWLTGGSTITSSGTWTVAAATGQTSGRVIGTCGAGTSVSLCALVAGDLPIVTAAKGGTGLDTSGSTGVLRVSAGTWSADAGISHLASSTSAALRGVLSDETGTGAAVFGTSPTVTDAIVNQAANGDAAITSTRATDTSPTGSFSLYKSAAGATLWNVDITGSLAAGTVPVARVTGLATSATTDTTNAANISSGTVGTARLGSGTANNTTFLRGDQTWASPTTVVAGAWDAANRNSSDQNVTTGALTDVTGLTYAIPSTGTYEFDSVLIMTSATATGNEAGLSYTGTGTVSAMMIGHSGSAQTVVGGAVSFSASGNQAGGVYCTATGLTCVVWIHGVLVASTTGTFSVQMDRLGGSGTSVAKANSTLKIRKVG